MRRCSVTSLVTERREAQSEKRWKKKVSEDENLIRISTFYFCKQRDVEQHGRGRARTLQHTKRPHRALQALLFVVVNSNGQ